MATVRSVLSLTDRSSVNVMSRPERALQALRQRLREALQGQDLLIDHVSTVADAAQYCQDGAPHVLLFESAFQGDALGGQRNGAGHSGKHARERHRAQLTSIELRHLRPFVNCANAVYQLGVTVKSVPRNGSRQ